MTVSPETDVKVRYGVWGSISGAIIVVAIGFIWGGWQTAGASQKMIEEAVMTSQTAICVAQFMGAPGHDMAYKEMQKTDRYEKAVLIEKGGWDKMPGQEKASFGVSSACVAGIEARSKPGA
jgi:hypothetical protein